MTILERLQSWYLSQCDEDWEHEYGVEISTLDNPGWLVKIDLSGTALDGLPFTPIDTQRSEHNWFHISTTGAVFEIACGPKNLEESLGIFCDWAGA